MGGKSFDHTKKYWFNRLRKEFLLEVAEAPKVATEKTPSTMVAEGPESAPTAPKSGVFKPRFKPKAAVKPAADAAVTPQKDAEKPEEASQTGNAASPKPVGFKPRFKPGVTPVKKAESEGSPEPSDTAASKPMGFKPRFKAGKTINKKDN